MAIEIPVRSDALVLRAFLSGMLEVPGSSGSGCSLLDVKLDYRDGLVDFGYDPKRVQTLVR